MLPTGRSRALSNIVEESLDRATRRPLGAEPRLPLDPPKLAEQFAVRVAGARALDLRAYNPVAAVARDRRGAKLRNEQAADGVRRILTDTGLEPEFHGGVQQKGLEHRTRNAVTAISASDGLFCTVLFSLRILAKPSTTTLSVSCAATGLGSKMVARCSVFVRSQVAGFEYRSGGRDDAASRGFNVVSGARTRAAKNRRSRLSACCRP